MSGHTPHRIPSVSHYLPLMMLCRCRQSVEYYPLFTVPPATVTPVKYGPTLRITVPTRGSYPPPVLSGTPPRKGHPLFFGRGTRITVGYGRLYGYHARRYARYVVAKPRRNLPGRYENVPGGHTIRTSRRPDVTIHTVTQNVPRFSTDSHGFTRIPRVTHGIHGFPLVGVREPGDQLGPPRRGFSRACFARTRFFARVVCTYYCIFSVLIYILLSVLHTYYSLPREVQGRYSTTRYGRQCSRPYRVAGWPRHTYQYPNRARCAWNARACSTQGYEYVSGSYGSNGASAHAATAYP